MMKNTVKTRPKKMVKVEFVECPLWTRLPSHCHWWYQNNRREVLRVVGNPGQLGSVSFKDHRCIEQRYRDWIREVFDGIKRNRELEACLELACERICDQCGRLNIAWKRDGVWFHGEDYNPIACDAGEIRDLIGGNEGSPDASDRRAKG